MSHSRSSSGLRPTPPRPDHQARDEVCSLPHADPAYRVLVYYDMDGIPTFEKKIPLGINLADQQLELLREGREWHAESRHRAIHLVEPGSP